MPDYSKLRQSLRMDRRYIEAAEIRLAGEGDVPKEITGYAAIFNAEAEIMPGIREIVRQGAFKKTIRESDIRALFNHNPDMPLGRTKSAGTLKLWEDDKGLGFRTTPPDTSYANDLRVNIQAGIVTQASFGFRVIKDRWTEDMANKTLLRELLEVKLYDVSPATFATYPQTEVHVRGLVDSLLRKQEAAAGIDDEERAAVLAALELLKDYLTPDPAAPGARQSGDRPPDPAAPGARQSEEADGCDLSVLRMRLQLIEAMQ